MKNPIRITARVFILLTTVTLFLPLTSRGDKRTHSKALRQELKVLPSGKLDEFIRKNSDNKYGLLCSTLVYQYWVNPGYRKKLSQKDRKTLSTYLLGQLKNKDCPKERDNLLQEFSNIWLQANKLNSLIQTHPELVKIISNIRLSSSYRGRKGKSHPINKLTRDDYQHLLSHFEAGYSEACPHLFDIPAWSSLHAYVLTRDKLQSFFKRCYTCQTEELEKRCLSKSLREFRTDGKYKSILKEGFASKKDLLAFQAALERFLELKGKSKDAILWLAKMKTLIQGSVEETLTDLQNYKVAGASSLYLLWIRRELKAGGQLNLELSSKQRQSMRLLAEQAAEESAIYAKSARKFFTWLDEQEGNSPKVVKKFKTELDQELIQAIRAQDLEKVKQLLSAGASANAKHHSTPALQTALSTKSIAIAKELVNAGADLEKVRGGVLSSRLARADLDLFVFLMDKGALPLEEHFIYAIKKARLDFAEAILKRDVFSLQSESWKKLPLVEAVQSNQLESVNYLIKQGAPVNAATKLGKTLYELARSDQIKLALENAGVIKDYYTAFLTRLKKKNLRPTAVNTNSQGSCSVGKKINFLDYKDKNKILEREKFKKDLLRELKKVDPKISELDLKPDSRSNYNLEVYETCSDWIRQCMDSKEGSSELENLRRLDDCVYSSPRCSANQEEKLPCCPEKCFSRYRELRCHGMKIDSYSVVFAFDRQCFAL